MEVFEVITGFQLLSILQAAAHLLPSPHLKLRIVERFYISVGSLISLENSVLELQIFDILLGNQAKCWGPPRSGKELHIVFWNEANLKADVIFKIILFREKEEVVV